MNNVQKENYIHIYKRRHVRNRIWDPSREVITSKISAYKSNKTVKNHNINKQNNNQIHIETYNCCKFGGSWYGMVPPRLL